jgi:hypothetical protein
MATYYISRLQDGKYKIVRMTKDGVSTPVPMNRIDLERYLRDGQSSPGPLDVLTVLDVGETVMVTMND